MPVTQKIIGTGLTKRPSLTISGSLGEEVGTGITIYVSGPMSEEQVAAANAAMKDIAQTSTFEGHATLWEAWCQDVLRKANLPPWDKDVRIYANGDWADDLPEDWYQRPNEIRKSDEEIGRAINIVEKRDRIDSPEWFAAKILGEIDLVRIVIARGEIATVAHLALELGIRMHTAESKFRWEPDAVLGMKHRRISSKGGKGRRRTKEDEHAQWQATANKILKDHPDMPWGRVLSRVAAEFTMSISNVRKYIRNPKQ